MKENLHREVRASIRRDRAGWLDEQLAGGNWKGVRSLMEKPPSQILQLPNTVGKLVGGEEKVNCLQRIWKQSNGGNYTLMCIHPKQRI